MSDAGGLVYQFADFTLEVKEHRLRQDQQEIYLRPKTFQTLLYLVERHGHLVEKDELLECVWANTIVTETAMTHCIEEVRKALGDDAYNPRYLKTIPRIGYKFIAPVKAISIHEEDEIIEEEYTAVKIIVTEEEPDSERAIKPYNEKSVITSPAVPSLPRIHIAAISHWWKLCLKLLAAIMLLMLLIVGIVHLFNPIDHPIQSLAVLPFANLNADAEQEYFVDGMTEALITDLAKIGELKVISRTSSMRYKETRKSLSEIGRELNVDAIIEGSVLRSDKKVRINAQLIQVSTDQHLWAESYERALDNILALQSDVARAIANAIKIKLTPQDQMRLANKYPVKPDAYQAYLKGRYFWNKRTEEGFKQGIDYFQLATALDSSYAPSYAGIADCYNLLYDYDLLPPQHAIPSGKAAALKALQIDPALTEAHASLGFAIARYDWDWVEAEHELKQAIKSNPNYAIAHHWYALQLAMMGRFPEAMSEINTALELDPLSLITNANVGWLLYFSRQYEQAQQQLHITVAMDPNFMSAHVKLGWVYEQKGLYQDALAEFQQVLALSRDESNVIELLANSYALLGEKTEAIKMINKLKDHGKQKYISPYWLAVIYTSLGEKDEAFAWLDRAYKEKCSSFVWLKVDPKLDPLRSDPRFDVLLKGMGLD